MMDRSRRNFLKNEVKPMYQVGDQRYSIYWQTGTKQPT
jgi:hypothetical protein